MEKLLATKSSHQRFLTLNPSPRSVKIRSRIVGKKRNKDFASVTTKGKFSSAMRQGSTLAEDSNKAERVSKSAGGKRV
jgi:hypothetical protein